MKVPPKRKGNVLNLVFWFGLNPSLNESPSEKEGKSGGKRVQSECTLALNESPSEKEGKSERVKLRVELIA